MIRTSVRRALVAVTMTAAAATGTTVAVAPAAHATGATCTTTTTLDESGKTSNHVVQWTDFEAVHVNVAAQCTGGSYNPTIPLGGTTTLERSYDGGQTWTTVAVSGGTDASYISRYGVNYIKRNTYYRATYTGGTDSNSNTYASSSDTLVVAVFRKSTYTWKSVRGGVRYNFRIAPTASIRGLRVPIQKKKGTRWVFVRSIRATSTGHVIGTFGIGNYKMLMPAKRGFIASYRTFGVTRG